MLVFYKWWWALHKYWRGRLWPSQPAWCSSNIPNQFVSFLLSCPVPNLMERAHSSQILATLVDLHFTTVGGSHGRVWYRRSLLQITSIPGLCILSCPVSNHICTIQSAHSIQICANNFISSLPSLFRTSWNPIYSFTNKFLQLRKWCLLTVQKQARKLQATLVWVRNYDRLTDWLTDGGEV